MNDLPEILETSDPVREATGFVFTEGPVWHPDDIWYFNDILNLHGGVKVNQIDLKFGVYHVS